MMKYRRTKLIDLSPATYPSVLFEAPRPGANPIASEANRYPSVMRNTINQDGIIPVLGLTGKEVLVRLL